MVGFAGIMTISSQVLGKHDDGFSECIEDESTVPCSKADVLIVKVMALFSLSETRSNSVHCIKATLK